MIDVHNKSTYDHAYCRFSTAFIKEYSDHRRKGHNSRDSLTAARTAVQEEMAKELFSRPQHNQRTIIKAFNDVRKDTALIEDAIRYYKEFKIKEQRLE